MLESITINGCKNINDYAFANCTNLENIVMEEGVEKIGDNAF